MVQKKSRALERPTVYIGKSEITERYQVRVRFPNGQGTSICSHYEHEDAKETYSFIKKKISRADAGEIEFLYTNPNLYTLVELYAELKAFNVDNVPLGIRRTCLDGTTYLDSSPKGMLDIGAVWDEEGLWDRESTREKFYKKWKSRA